MRASLRSTSRTLTLRNVSLLHMRNMFLPILDSTVSHSFHYISSDHRITTAKICLSLHRKRNKQAKLLYIDLRPGQTCHSKVMHQKEVTHSNGSYERESRRRAWLMKWDKVKKSHSTLIDWCTRREWPVNCMTVISTWWRSNMPFQRLSGWLSGCWTII